MAGPGHDLAALVRRTVVAIRPSVTTAPIHPDHSPRQFTALRPAFPNSLAAASFPDPVTPSAGPGVRNLSARSADHGPSRNNYRPLPAPARPAGPRRAPAYHGEISPAASTRPESKKKPYVERIWRIRRYARRSGSTVMHRRWVACSADTGPRRAAAATAGRSASRSPLAVPMALGLTLGIMLAVSGGNTTHVAQSSRGGLGHSVRERLGVPSATWPARTPPSPTPSPSSAPERRGRARRHHTTRQRATATTGPAG